MKRVSFLTVELLIAVTVFGVAQGFPVEQYRITIADGRQMASLCGLIYKDGNKEVKINLLKQLMQQNAVGSLILDAQMITLDKPTVIKLEQLFQKERSPLMTVYTMDPTPIPGGSDEQDVAVPFKDEIDPQKGVPARSCYYMTLEDAQCMTSLYNALHASYDADKRRALLIALMRNPIGLSVLTAQVDALRFQDVDLAEALFNWYPTDQPIKYAYSAARVGAAYQEAGRYDDALRLYKKSLDAMPMHAVMTNIELLRVSRAAHTH